MIADLTTKKNTTYPVDNFREIKQKVLTWIKQFDTFCFLDNHQYNIGPHTQECLLAAGVKRKLSASCGTALTQLQTFIDAGNEGWLFGHLSYDLKNEIEKLSSIHSDHVGFPDLFFFEPAIVIRLNENAMMIEAEDSDSIFSEISTIDLKNSKPGKTVEVQARFLKEKYISIVQLLKQHILRGDCYEINFCQEFFADGASIDPIQVYQQLSKISPNPFSGLYKVGEKWLICASPERYLQKQGLKILSQPIKGTSKRIQENTVLDTQAKEDLFLSSKDRSENVMVVDVVRNDLARVCKEGTVNVTELYGIYSFPQVHQMISTISGELKDGISFSEIIRATFPMGSMTGAPKKSVMELIDKYEHTRRGIFSGAVGYISPEGNFDFNVVIRSLMYNAINNYLSYQVGSGITYYSDPEKEWEECLLKAAAIKEALSFN